MKTSMCIARSRSFLDKNLSGNCSLLVLRIQQRSLALWRYAHTKTTLVLLIILLFLLSCSQDREMQESALVDNEETTSSLLKSKYFKQVPQAQDIVLGNSVLLSSTSERRFSTKISSALTMLGYDVVDSKYDSQPGVVRALKLFKRAQRLPRDQQGNQGMVDKDTLLSLDSQLVQQESYFQQKAAPFPLSISAKDSARVTSDYLAAMIVIAWEALPPPLVDFSEENIVNCYLLQCGGGYGSFIRNGEGRTVDEIVPGEVYVLHHAMFLGSQTHSPTDLLAFTIHEYAHYLDAAIYAPKLGTKQGIIDTRNFYQISFSGVEELGPFPIYDQKSWLPLRAGIDENADFVNNYASKKTTIQIKEGSTAGYTYVEDFAESFAAYVISGRQFRERALDNEIMGQKYDWLKNNVFQGVEYDTDLPRMESEQPLEYVFAGSLLRK